MFRLRPKAHLEKAERNKDFVIKSLMSLADKFPDWISTVAFYSALHFVAAYLVKEHGLYCDDHEERIRAVDLHLSKIALEYKRLYDLALNSRYGSVEDNPEPKEAEDAVRIELTKIEEYVKPLL